MKDNKLITVTGPTATGKTRLAAHLAYHLNGEVISADSRQVYRGMDQGTGKDYEDYKVDGNAISYHLIDILPAGERYNLYEYQKDFIEAFKDVKDRGKRAVLCGGTGLYIDAVTRGYRLLEVPIDRELRESFEGKSIDHIVEELDKLTDLHNTTDTSTRPRALRALEIARYYAENPGKRMEYPEIESLFIGVKYQRNKERKNITERLKQRLKDGMIDEVKALHSDEGVSFDQLMYYGLEYKFVALYLKGDLTYDEMFERLNTAIHQFAKRQRTWFRKMEREGVNIHWMHGEESFSNKLRMAIDLINQKGF
jgi:tRNA dimethylallyltransferase